MRIADKIDEWRRVYWYRTYSGVSYVKSALWIIPFVAILLVLLVTNVAHRIDAWLGWVFFDYSLAGAEALYQFVVTLTLSFVVFTFGSLLVAIQVASGQMTPRVIATTLLRDNTVRYTVGLFVFTMLFSQGALIRTDIKVHQLVTVIVLGLGLSSLAAFLFFIDYTARLLRPGSIVATVANEGSEAIRKLYPQATSPQGDPAEQEPELGQPSHVICHQGKSAIVLAVNLKELVAQLRGTSGFVEFVPRVGDLVATDEPLFRCYGTGRFDEQKLRAKVALGPERTMEQDPLFPFRILIDIALKALSKAINDPTTAVLAIDQLHRLLRDLGKRHLSGEAIRDSAGQLKIVFHTPNWEDYVHLTFTELRLNGSDSIQVARRLRAMIEDLMKTLPEHRHLALQRELELLDSTIEISYQLPQDLALARIPDSQGLGGSARDKALLNRTTR